MLKSYSCGICGQKEYKFGKYQNFTGLCAKCNINGLTNKIKYRNILKAENSNNKQEGGSMPEIEGIKETKELIKFICKLSVGIDKSIEDGKFTLADLMHFIPVIQAAINAFENIKQVKEELKDLSQSELNTLKQYFIENFDLTNDEVEAKIEEGASIFIDLLKFIVSLVKK